MSLNFLIVFPYPNVHLSPATLNLAEVLAERGHQITILSDPSFDESLLSHHPNVRYCRSPAVPGGHLAAMRQLVVLAGSIRKTYMSLSKDRRTTICITIDGAAAALTLAALNAPHVHLNLELPSTPNGVRVKVLTALYSQSYREAAAVIIQDQTRLNVLNRVLNYSAQKVFFQPVGPRGSEPRDLDRNYLRRRLRIPDSYTRIVLHAGMIRGFFLSPQLVSPLQHMPDTAVVIHGPDQICEKERYPSAPNFFYSHEIAAAKEYDSLLSSADIGLALYEGVDENFRLIGKAAGKMAYCLKHGKPVLTSALPSLMDVVNRTGCGEYVESPSAVIPKVCKILDSYERYSLNAVRCFEEEYEFDRHFDPILRWLESTF